MIIITIRILTHNNLLTIIINNNIIRIEYNNRAINDIDMNEYLWISIIINIIIRGCYNFAFLRLFIGTNIFRSGPL